MFTVWACYTQKRALKALNVWHVGLMKHFGKRFQDDDGLLPECSMGFDDLPASREGSGQHQA